MLAQWNIAVIASGPMIVHQRIAVGGESEEEQSPPEGDLAEVVRMAGIGPQPVADDVAGLLGAGEASQLLVGNELDEDRAPVTTRATAVEKAERTAAARQRRDQSADSRGRPCTVGKKWMPRKLIAHFGIGAVL